MSTMTQPCEYEYCNCTVTGGMEGASYCSPECESRDDVQEQNEVDCICGHSPCDEP
jgi:hypothetical protein